MTNPSQLTAWGWIVDHCSSLQGIEDARDAGTVTFRIGRLEPLIGGLLASASEVVELRAKLISCDAEIDRLQATIKAYG